MYVEIPSYLLCYPIEDTTRSNVVHNTGTDLICRRWLERGYFRKTYRFKIIQLLKYL